MPSIAQQDYIIIDWEGKGSSDSEKKAEVDAQLKNIYLANPLALLSVIFKHYNADVTENTYYQMLTVESRVGDGSSATIAFFAPIQDEIVVYTFSIE